MKLDYLATVRAMSRALELCDGNHMPEAEALRLAWLEQRENNHKRPEPQLALTLKDAPCPTESSART